MTRIALALVALLPACVIVDEDHHPSPEPYVNYAPFLNYAEAGCYWDGYYGDFIWYFQADADDPNGVYDVISVWADVYDGPSGAWVDSFELYADPNDPYIWFSDWLGSTTYLNCGYANYEVDIVAYDTYESYAVATVLPYIY